MYAHAINQAGNLYAGIRRQILNEMAGVEYVSANLIRGPVYDRFHDVGSVFMRTLVVKLFSSAKFIALFGPTFNLVDTAAGVFVQRDVIALDEFRIL